MNTSTTTAADGTTTTNIDGFTIGSKTFNAKYDDSGVFTGYFDGGGKQYLNPDISIANGGFNPFDPQLTWLDVTFNVKNVDASGLQIIQICSTTPIIGKRALNSLSKNGASVTSGFIDGQYTFFIGSTKFAGEVDGGLGSYSSIIAGGNPTNVDRPYYYSKERLYNKRLGAGLKWDGFNGSISTLDHPTAATDVEIMNFTTIIVATDYMGTKKDVVLGTFRWGYTDYMMTPTHSHSIDLKGNVPTLTDVEIINHYYPKYSFFK